MGIREQIQNRRSFAVSIAGLFIVMAVGLIVWNNSSGLPSKQEKAFYSDDNGKSWFEDDINKVSPFDHNRKQAVRVYLYRAGSGQPFVGYLARLNEAGHKQMLDLMGKPRSGETIDEINKLINTNLEVKKPTGDKWVLISSPDAGSIITPTPPSGQSGELAAVYP
jgi:hypothetical protein